ncbi:MAG: hypothetical protein GPJ54_01500 [Candidatus Heimdallarchaeota archaeon]|nr:hypothetical protein [Candidatus Heimdallarchaeota archaeon]
MIKNLINNRMKRTKPYPQSPKMNYQEVEAFLNNAPIAVISTMNPDGTIHSSPVWFIFKNGEIHFGTQVISQKIANLKRDARVTVLIYSHEMPYKGVLFTGEAILVYDNVIMKRVAVFSKYVSKDKARSMVDSYASNFDPVYVRVIPKKISSWDYAK